jgi:hypothetical protein
VVAVDLAVARANSAGAQRFDRVGGATLKNAFFVYAHVSRNKILARYEEAAAAAQRKGQ